MWYKEVDYRNEEFWNTLTHGVGAVLSVVALVLMLVYSSINGTAMDIICSLIFGLGLISLYSASTLYHASRNPRKRVFLRRIDHLCIYLLIAGTYTPVTLLGLNGAWGWTFFGLVWGLVLLGFIFKFSPFRYNEKISLTLYSLMGWMGILAIKPLIDSLSPEALTYLGLGGLAYTIGIYFYANNKIRFNHLIWHLFVLAGSAFHFFGIFFYILP